MESFPTLNRAARPVLRRAWDIAWKPAIWMRMRRGGPLADLALDVGVLTVDLRDTGVAQPLYRYREYEPDERAIMRRLVLPGMDVLDIGAQVGYHTLLLSKLVGEDGTVLAVEASPANYDLLLRNMSVNAATNVTALNVAASDMRGQLDLSIDPRNLGAHRIVVDKSVKTTVSVPANTIDDIVQSRDVHPRFLKMDIEGSELAALRGMSKLLDTPDLVILAELNRIALTQMGARPVQLLAELEATGFALFLIEHGGLRAVTVADLVAASEYRDNVNFIAAKGAQRTDIVQSPGAGTGS